MNPTHIDSYLSLEEEVLLENMETKEMGRRNESVRVKKKRAHVCDSIVF
jgi:hypothetical protein